MIKLGCDEPALPKTRIKRYTWTDEQIEVLMRKGMWYVNRGRRVPWRRIASQTGHHESSCALKFHNIRTRKADLEERVRIDAEQARQERLRPPPVNKVPLPVRACAVDASIGGSTMRLMIDAEIRRRIEGVVITSGLLGDPPPGRSALDRKRAGVPDDPDTSDHRTAYYANAPKITLAGDTTR